MLSVEKTLKQEIEQWKHEYEVLDACCELAQGKIAELKAENDILKLSERDLSRICQGFKKDIENEKSYALKHYKTLQEIKKYIAKICKEECGYVQKKRCLDCDCRYGAILDLITKAEEE